VLNAGPTTPVISPSGVEDVYWQAFRPLTAEIGVTVWEGECLISLPARITSPTPDLVFWTNEGLCAASALIVGEAKLSGTDPVDASHAPMWRRIFEVQSTLQRPLAEREPVLVIRDVYSELRALIEWTRLPVEQLGELLGASRRTIYNWLAGRPIRDESQSRIFRLRDAIAAIASSRDPALVREWLLRGDPSPATLAVDERWNELEARAHEETAPIRPIDLMAEEGGGSRAESPEVLNAALLAFSTTSGRTASRRSEWRPSELTGIASDDEEEAE
jgi:transcriptional regulator with XRE-family HTH domain